MSKVINIRSSSVILVILRDVKCMYLHQGFVVVNVSIHKKFITLYQALGVLHINMCGVANDEHDPDTKSIHLTVKGCMRCYFDAAPL